MLAAPDMTMTSPISDSPMTRSTHWLYSHSVHSPIETVTGPVAGTAGNVPYRDNSSLAVTPHVPLASLLSRMHLASH